MKRLLCAVALFVCLTGAACDSQKRYAGLAQLGSAYVAALDRLLSVTASITVDATSERMLQDRVLAPPTLAAYRELSKIDVDRLAIITGLRSHTQLLGRYFATLGSLANSDAPARAGAAAGATIDSLNQLGAQLRGSDLVPEKSVFTALTKIVVGGAIRGALRDELEARGPAIQKELKTQEELLRALGAALKHDLTVTREIREQRLVIEPLLDPKAIGNPDAWIANRRAVLNLASTADELASASSAVKGLREAFENLMSGQLDPERIQSLQDDFGTLLAFAETVKKAI